MSSDITVTPIGVVRNHIQEAADDIWADVISRIDLDPARFTGGSLAGLADFSHVEILFVLHQVPEQEVVYEARHPRGRQDFPKVGIFAQRGRMRPNRIGLTVCRLRRVSDLAIEVDGLDAVDGTPILDIKPYMQEFGPRGAVRQPQWSRDLMSTYWGKQA